MKRIILAVVAILIWKITSAQTCSVQISDSTICEGATVQFVSAVSGGTATGYNWNFGNGFTSTTTAPAHTYVTPGVFNPTVTITFSGGATCNASAPQIRVFAKPDAKFTINGNDTLCFKDNQLCITDQSQSGPSNAPLLKRIFQLSNGFIQTDNPPFNNQICYQNTTDINGHLYSIVLEVSDTNNCVDRSQALDAVTLLPQLLPLSFTTVWPPSCYTSSVTFNNTSLIPRADLKSFTWIFGDGQTSSANWNNSSHVYSGPGQFLPLLAITDLFGCADTVPGVTYIQNTFPDTVIKFKLPAKQCHAKNAFNAYAINPGGVNFWSVVSATGDTVLRLNGDSAKFSMNTCGIFKLVLRVAYPACSYTKDTMIQVYGPKAIIQNKSNPNEKVLNTVQCEIHDTVYFKTPVPYLSCVSGNGSIAHVWDFGDAFAPNCTTDTKNGLNVGVNCRYSLDSMNVKHFYTPGREQCYMAKLVMTDPVTGCASRDSVTMALMQPDAGPDLSAIPPRRGLYFEGQPCIGVPIEFKFEETLPSCGYEEAWINIDSACGLGGFIKVDTANKKNYIHVYDSACSADKWVTVGLVIKNGADRNGNPCYDTAWYHHLFQLSPINPYFVVQVAAGCAPFEIKAIPDDSIQYDLTQVRWNFRPDVVGTGDTVVQSFGVNDSIIRSQDFAYNSAGIYRILKVVVNTSGCVQSALNNIGVGYKPEFAALQEVVCLGDTVELGQNVRYYKYDGITNLNPTDYWGDTLRDAANKEAIWWNLYDGLGFRKIKGNPRFVPTQPGRYSVAIATRDSSGCLDTLFRQVAYTVVELKAKIGTLSSAYYCAPQIVVFRDSSLVIDSVGSTVNSAADGIDTRLWDFGDQTPTSIFTNPAHNYTSNGVFNVVLKLTTVAGCVAYDTVVVDMKGPRPSFTIKDTLGCDPFSVVFYNTSPSNLKSYTWYFGDSANQTLTLLTNDSVVFTYSKPGAYKVRLLGTDDVFNPGTGNTITCNSFFPDQTTGLPERWVYVQPTPPLEIVSRDTICPNEVLELNLKSDPLYSRFDWDFGDGVTVSENAPDTNISHRFGNNGPYLVRVIPLHSQNLECIDTATKQIYIQPVRAEFTIDSTTKPDFVFQQAALNAVRYDWDLGVGAEGLISNQLKVLYTYKDTGTYQVCLKVFNSEGCFDSICHPVRIDKVFIEIPNVFTPDNNDGKNDAFDISILGYTSYDLKIYNRWGALVYESTKDGTGNDGINWNGKERNEGAICPAGTYFYIFSYQLITDPAPVIKHGTVTLIRDK